MRYDYILEAPGDTPGWGGWIPDVPGAIAEGDTEQATVRMLEEVLEGVLEFRRDNGLPIPEPAPYIGQVPAGCRLYRAEERVVSVSERRRAQGISL